MALRGNWIHCSSAAAWGAWPGSSTTVFRCLLLPAAGSSRHRNTVVLEPSQAPQTAALLQRIQLPLNAITGLGGATAAAQQAQALAFRGLQERPSQGVAGGLLQRRRQLQQSRAIEAISDHQLVFQQGPAAGEGACFIEKHRAD